VLLLVVLLLAVLTAAGVALQWVTGTERAASAFEWSALRALHAADAGVRWACGELRDPAAFLGRPEFEDPPDPFGSIRFPMPSHAHGPPGPFSGDPGEDGIRVDVSAPGYLGRRPCRTSAGEESGLFFLSFEIRALARESSGEARYSKSVVADVEIGPLPDGFPGVSGPGSPSEGDIIPDTRTTEDATGPCETGAFRCVVTNWREP
jgi:hypothetical protein